LADKFQGGLVFLGLLWKETSKGLGGFGLLGGRNGEKEGLGGIIGFPRKEGELLLLNYLDWDYFLRIGPG